MTFWFSSFRWGGADSLRLLRLLSAFEHERSFDERRRDADRELSCHKELLKDYAENEDKAL